MTAEWNLPLSFRLANAAVPWNAGKDYYDEDVEGACGYPGNTLGLGVRMLKNTFGPTGSQLEDGVDIGQWEIVLAVDHGPACLEFNDVEIELHMRCEVDMESITQYQEELVGSSVSVVYPKWFNATHDCEGDEDCSPNSWSEATEPRGAYISSFTFSVSWESEDEDRRRLAHAAAAAAPPAAAGAESRAAAAAAVAVAVICVTLTYVQNAAAARQREELRAELRAAREQTKADIAELLAAAGRPAAPGAKDAAAAAAT